MNISSEILPLKKTIAKIKLLLVNSRDVRQLSFIVIYRCRVSQSFSGEVAWKMTKLLDTACFSNF